MESLWPLVKSELTFIWLYGSMVFRGLFMLRKTTIYLEESEIETLKRLSFIQNTSMTDLIRKGIQHLYQSFSKDEMKALETLGEIRMASEKKGLSANKIMTDVLVAQKEVRRERKKSRR
jgi:hypothetical protein